MVVAPSTCAECHRTEILKFQCRNCRIHFCDECATELRLHCPSCKRGSRASRVRTLLTASRPATSRPWVVMEPTVSSSRAAQAVCFLRGLLLVVPRPKARELKWR